METLKAWNLVPRRRLFEDGYEQAARIDPGVPSKAWLSDVKCALDALYFTFKPLRLGYKGIKGEDTDAEKPKESWMVVVCSPVNLTGESSGPPCFFVGI